MSYKIYSSEKGQTIIEIIAALSIASILIVALVALSVRSSRSADSSNAQNQASKLAEEGIEVLKSIKSANAVAITYTAACSSGAGTTYSWTGLYAIGGGVDESCNTLGKPGRLVANCGGGWCLLLQQNVGEALTLEKRTFTRQVFVSDSSPKSSCNTTVTDYNAIKQFSVVVSWDESSGSRNVINTICLGPS